MIKAKHNEHEITYHEDQNEWRCHKLRMTAPSLAALRTKINDADREDRRLNKLASNRKDSFRLTSIVLDTPENAKKIAAWRAAKAALEAANDAIQKTSDALPRPTREQLMKLGTKVIA